MGTIQGFNPETESALDWNNKNSAINKGSLHACIIGPTGSGKTKKALDLISERLKNGDGILVFDAKQVLQQDLALYLDKARMFQLGIDSGGDNCLQINLFTHICQSEAQIARFAKSILVDPAQGSHVFWSQAASDMMIVLMNIYSNMNLLLIKASKASQKELEFSTDITYKSGEELKKISFSISSIPMTFSLFFTNISIREKFRHVAGNILTINKEYITYIKKHIDIDNLSREEALAFDMHFDKIEKYSKIMATYILPMKEDFSGESGALWSMKAGIPSLLYTDKTLNATFDSHNIKTLLEKKEGNCVIISANDLRVQSLLFNLYAEHFSLRSSFVQKNNVTFFVDEPASITGTGTSINLEHYLTFSRSSKLSIISLWQSSHQIHNAFGPNRAESILENVTRIFLSEQRDSKYFYYTVDDDDYLFRFETRFATEKEKYEALNAYQKETGEFASIERTTREVVLYNHSFYEAFDQTVTIVNIDTLNSRSVKFIANEAQYHGHFMNKWKEENEVLEAIGIEI